MEDGEVEVAKNERDCGAAEGAAASPRRQRRLRVVKLGGSVLAHPRLGAILQTLSAGVSCDAPLVLVPGGGPFADAVRAAQGMLRLDDETAHHLAVLAMAQSAWVLQARDPHWVRCANLPAVCAAVDAGVPALWAPVESPPTAFGWHVTSDSLAAWLAGALEADELVLLKSCRVPADVSAQVPAQAERSAAECAVLEAWALAAVVDPAFPAMAGGFPGAVRVHCVEDDLPSLGPV